MTHDPMKSAAADAAATAAAYFARHTYSLGYEAGVRSTDADEARLGHTLMLLDEARETIEHIRAEGAKTLEEATAALVEAQSRIRTAIRARDEVGIQLAAAQAEIARMQPVVDAARSIDGIRNGDVTEEMRAISAALAALDTVPGDVLPRPIDTEDPAAGLLAASGVDVKGVE